MSKYVRKTRDIWEVWSNYGRDGYGWEYACGEESRAEGMARVREYRANAPQYAHQLRKLREPINA
jgi:hypothetical protein